jgi:HlyD family secretion protein/adhesin transport system membrane fusion protein
MLGIEQRHLSQSILLEETGNPLVIRAVILFVFFLLLAFVGWASVARVDEVAMAGGEIQPKVKLQQVQSFDGGIVAEILVKDGTPVEKGQVVMRLDTFAMRSELREAQAERDSLQAQQSRLQTLLEKQLPAGRAKRLPQTAATAPQNLDNGRLIFANPYVQDLTNRGKRLALKREAIQKELDVKAALAAKRYYPEVSLLSLQRDLGEVDADIAEINEKLVTEYTRIGNEQITVEEKIKRLEEKLRLAEIHAPAAGVVHGLKAHTVGGVIGKGEEIMDIVPADSPLEAVVKISPRDIGHVRVGQPTKLRFTAYDFSRYGVAYGTLRDISASAFLDKDGATPYHQGLVALQSSYVGPVAGRNPILPGMTLQADIVTGSKTVLEYLLKPIYASAKQVFRER